eukprot:Ihof_evm2s441 gene=Ihof_evmTU2s441
MEEIAQSNNEKNILKEKKKGSLKELFPRRPSWVAPLDIPLERRMQTLAVLIFVFLQISFVMFNIYIILTPSLWVFYIPYVLWIHFVDYEASKNGVGRRVDFLRDLEIWKKAAGYFPVKLHKTVDLDPKKHYLFAYHPHGIIGVGSVFTIGTNACGVYDLFPGIKIQAATLAMNFKLPFYREILLWMGFCDCGHTSVNNVLSSPTPGTSMWIVVGGAAEALDAHPGTNDLTLMKRKGFIKFALRHGASLVPVFGFGENNVWNQVPNPPGSKVRTFQEKIGKVMGFTMPLVFGRGIFQYKFGIVPYRHAVNVV